MKKKYPVCQESIVLNSKEREGRQVVCYVNILPAEGAIE